MKEKIFLFFKILFLSFITLGIFSMTKKTWIIALGAGFVYQMITVHLLEEHYGESRPATIAAFIGTIFAAIIRVTIEGADGIIFYVMASISNAAFSALMSLDFVYENYRNHNRNTVIRNTRDAYRYVQERNYLESRHTNFGYLNAVIFGIFALVGCFRPMAAFLPLAWLSVRLLYVIIRSRLF